MRTSEVLTGLAVQPGERVTVSDIIATLRERAFALLIVLLGLADCVPMPPPVPSVCAVLLIVVAAQIGAGRRTPWLPQRIMESSIARRDVERAVVRVLPLVEKLERFAKPRLRLFDGGSGAVMTSVILVLLAVGILTAAPFVGHIPFGIAVALIGLGQVERDGFIIAAGLLAATVGAALSASFIYGLVLGYQHLT